MSIFKACDVRGIYGKELTEADAYAIGRALRRMLPGGARVAVGGDVRLSTPSLKREVIRGLVESGAQVADLGTIPTPMLYFAHATGRYDASLTVTASHNPPKYNGMKFIIGEKPLVPETVAQLAEIVRAGDFTDQPGGKCAREDVNEAYISSFEARFGVQKRLRIVADAGNGAMSAVAPEVLRRLGHEVIELFCTPDGAFPNRDPNPAEYDKLGAVCAKVRQTGADFGVAFDGDGDRAVFIDDAGRPVLNEKSLVLFIRRILRDRTTPVVYDQKSSGVVKAAVLEMGGEPIPERSGHAFIKKRFLECGAALAGEVSGHFFFGELGYDDGLFAACTMAALLGEDGRKLGALTEGIILPPITPDLRIACPYAEQDEKLRAMETLGEASGCCISRMDGVRLEWPDGWILVRKSVTAEQMTIRAEADTQEKLKERIALTAKALNAPELLLFGKN